MRKILMLFSLILLCVLVACSGTKVEEKAVDSVELTEDKENEDKAKVAESETEDNETDDGEKQEFNKEIVDNETAKVTLISVEKIIDSHWDEEKIEVKFEVENKREDTIEVQAREVSADGKMVDEMMLSMSQEVSGGKLADAVLTIQNFEGDLPVIEENIEMILHIFSWDDYEFEENMDVKIEF